MIKITHPTRPNKYFLPSFSVSDFTQNDPNLVKKVVTGFMGRVALDLAIRWLIPNFLGKILFGPKLWGVFCCSDWGVFG